MALTDNLVAHYLLRDNANDETGTYDGIDHNGVVFDGASALFDGNNDYIDSTYKTSINYNTYSISLWCKRNTIDTSDALYCEINSTSSSYGTFMQFSSDGVTLNIGHFKGVSSDYDEVGGDISSHISSMTEWNHIVFTRTNNGLHGLYINGVLFDTTWCAEVLNDSSFTGKIGGNPDYSSSPTLRAFDGSISNFRIYDDEKNQAFVDELYAEGHDDQSFVKDIFSDVSEDIVRYWTHFLDTSRDLIPTYQTFSDVSEDDILSTYIFQDISVDHQGYIQIFSDVSANTGGLKWSRFYDISNDESTIFEDILIKRVN